MNLKRLLTIGIMTLFLLNNGLVVCGQSLPDETSVHSWSESNSNIAAVSYSLPEWILYDTKDVTVDKGSINLKSYVMTLLNDTKLCKATTEHSSYFYGYVRARFETIFGAVHSGSDSGRKMSYWGTTAETPGNDDAGGWNGVAHTYCNSL